jgi:outer membrane protein
MSERLKPWRWVACAALSLTAVACQNELFRDAETPYTASKARLNEMGTFDPVKESTGPVVTLGEAGKDLAADPLPSQTPPPQRDMTLAEVRSSALKRNLDLKVQLFNPALAKTAIGKEMAKFEASITANYTHTDQNVFSSLANGNNGLNDNASVGLNVPLATGGTVSLAGVSQMTNADLAAFSPGTQDSQGGMQFSLAQPILQGAGVEANTASIRVAKLNGQIADARTKLEAIRLLANADKAYWNLYAAARELEVRQQQYELAVAQLERARRRVRAGETAEIEVIRAESGVGSTIENIIGADNRLRLRQRDLKRLMNDPDLTMDSPTYIATTTPPSPVGLKFDPETLATKALDNRMEMLELELQLAIDATAVDLARNKALPLCTVNYQYQNFGYGTNIGNAWSSLGDADQYTAGFSANIPLGNEAAKNSVQSAILTRLQRLATKDQRRQSIRQEVFNAMDNLENAWRRILASRLETALAGRTYEAEKRQFDVGLRTSTDVLDAASRLGDAQSREVTALASWQIALVDLAFATGTQLGQARIDWTEILAVPSAAQATDGWGGWGFNNGSEVGNYPVSSSGEPLKQEDLQGLAMPVTGPAVQPSKGLGVKPELPDAPPVSPATAAPAPVSAPQQPAVPPTSG